MATGRRATTKATIKKQTAEAMKKLGVYTSEYDPIIDIYSELREQFEKLTDTFTAGGYKFSVETSDGGEKKSPLVATLESLRKDILAYSDRLCLNPKAIENITRESKTKSKLEELMGKLP